MTITFPYFRAIVLAMMMVFTVTAHADVVKGIAAYKVGYYQTALNEFHKSADEGDALAQLLLGNMYKFVEEYKDTREAFKWYRLAAEQGVAEAQFSLGTFYADGEGVLQDYKEALKWYHLAAKQGYLRAHHNLGISYGSGHGMAQDLSHAHMWANIAAYNGNDLSVQLRELVETRMTPQQISNAQAMARTCLESQYKNC